ncbi:hypothetical protein I6I98_04620 [Sphingobacterium multivorum]|uniref:SMI1/KNR4 family protein n=1 Tax=Sphingobacterium multivorum TaxID=28454 RepID=A0ABX7CTH8_SPHMU|nr:hypothetical protein [Sphingobacterium multivorum]QQT54545.1 hypothetical protein I6I98_04620 [Sphingobacterium multivorum]
MNCGKLYFHLERKESPYEEELPPNEIWGIIQLCYESDNKIEYILDWQWDIVEIVEWFDEAKDLLAVKNIDVLNDENKSIAELRDLGYERSFFFSEDEQFSYYSELEECFSSFKFHFRGTPTPMYYIGLNNGKGEISYYSSEQEVYKRYCFNMEEFLNNTNKVLMDFRQT